MNLDRVATLIASGLKPAQVATIVGVTPARISQLLSSDESFKLILADKSALVEKSDIEEVSLSAKYTAAEHALVDQVMNMAPSAELRDVTAALRVISERQEKAKSRILNPNQQTNNNLTIVSISLPTHALPERVVEMTSNREVIAIGEQTLAPLNSSAVTKLFAAMRTPLNVPIEMKGEENERETTTRSTKASLIEALSTVEESFLDYASASS